MLLALSKFSRALQRIQHTESKVTTAPTYVSTPRRIENQEDEAIRRDWSGDHGKTLKKIEDFDRRLQHVRSSRSLRRETTRSSCHTCEESEKVKHGWRGGGERHRQTATIEGAEKSLSTFRTTQHTTYEHKLERSKARCT